MIDEITGEDILVWLCRSEVSEFLLKGSGELESVFDIADRYGCTRVLAVFDGNESKSVGAVRAIKGELERRNSRMAGEHFKALEVPDLDNALSQHAGSAIYVVPDEQPLPPVLNAMPKYWFCATEMLPWPAWKSSEDLGSCAGTAKWTKYFLLGRHSVEKSLEHVRTILSNQGTAGVPQYVLITGETGTGKSFIARNLPKICRPEYDDWEAAFKEASSEERKDRRYGYLQGNCASLSPQLADALLFGAVDGAYTGRKGTVDGLIEGAGDGILFLDEVGAMPLETQGKLLTALEEKVYYRLGDTGQNRKPLEVNCRIIFGTNRDLAAAAQEWEESKGARGFRKDLLYRINSCHIELPPLRERLGAENQERRREVFEGLVKWYGASFDLALTRSACETFEAFAYSYPWPENFRDVKRLFEHLKIGLLEANVGKVVSAHAMKEALADLFSRGDGPKPDEAALSLSERLKRNRPPREHAQIDRMFKACLAAQSCADAGRAFFENERKSNYSDAFRKHLARWGLAFDVNVLGHLKLKETASAGADR